MPATNSGMPDKQGYVVGAEEAHDLDAALESADGGVDDPDVQFRGGELGMVAGEVGSMVAVQGFGNAVHRPRRIGLAPDRLPQRQRGVDGGGRAGDEEVEFGAVGLPNLARPFGAAAVNEFVPVPV